MYAFKSKHFSTILAIMRPSPLLGFWGNNITTRRDCLATPDGDPLFLDWYQYTGPGYNPFITSYAQDIERPLVLVIHGLMGHSEESYVRQTCAEICVKDPRHPKVVAMNYRGAFNHTLGESGKGGYSLYDTVDLSVLINHLRKFHHGPLYAVGFSMGAAKLTNYLGRTGSASMLDAASCVSCPWDFGPNNSAVHRPSMSERIYHLVMTTAMKGWVLAHYTELKSNPLVVKSQAFSKSWLQRLRWFITVNDMKTFDSTFTKFWVGYPDVDTYYKKASPCNVLHSVATPLLIINSENDPLIPKNVNPDERDCDNPALCAVETKYGGHIGFWTPFRGCWTTQTIIKFFARPEVSTELSEVVGARKRDEVRRRNSLDLATKLRDTSLTHLTDYSILLNMVDNDNAGETEAIGEDEKHVMEKVELFRKSPRKPQGHKGQES